MPDEPDLTPAIEAAAAEPAKVASDGQEVDSRPIADLIAADKYLKEQALLKGGVSGWGCTRPARVVPPGTTGLRNTEG